MIKEGKRHGRGVVTQANGVCNMTNTILGLRASTDSVSMHSAPQETGMRGNSRSTSRMAKAS